MSTIRILPNALVNKIAAGEVIERPANVVKELLENAIDAGAGHIQVAIEDGGRSLIRVIDDGSGMTPDDLRLAVAPHATSKLIDEEDLFNVATLGFRGEALASIGAVAKLRLVSRRPEAPEGAEIVVVGEEVRSAAAAGCQPGTIVEVRDLFCNLPARRKFLKTAATEIGHINEQLARVALAQRGIEFELSHNGRVSQRLRAGAEMPERVAALFGEELASGLLHIEREERGLHIEAWVAPPAQSRSTPAWQYFFVNGRYIRDRFLQHAVREAYRGLLDPTRYPVVFVFLTIDPRSVDVNVHPTKIEVRWQEPNLLHSQVLAALRDKFLRSDLTPALRNPAAPPGAADAGMEADELRRQAADYLKQVVPASAERPPAFDAGYGDARPADRSGPRTEGRGPGPDIWHELYRPADPHPDDPVRGAGPVAPAGGSWPPAAGEAQRLARTIQVHNTYLVTETAEGLVIIDQHALHERIIYEQLKARIVGGSLESQRLLLPETFAATARHLAVLRENESLLAQLGIEAEPFGHDSIVIQAFPTVLKNVDTAAFVRDLLDRLAVRGGRTNAEEALHELLDMMACKAAVKAGDALSLAEIDSLIAQKDLIEKGSNCPHGRPTTLRLTVSELEKQFKRR